MAKKKFKTEYSLLLGANFTKSIACPPQRTRISTGKNFTAMIPVEWTSASTGQVEQWRALRVSCESGSPAQLKLSACKKICKLIDDMVLDKCAKDSTTHRSKTLKEWVDMITQLDKEIDFEIMSSPEDPKQKYRDLLAGPVAAYKRK